MDDEKLAQPGNRRAADPSTDALGRLGRALVAAGRAGEWDAALESSEAPLDFASLGAERLALYEKERVSFAAWKLPPDLAALVVLVSSWRWLDEKRTLRQRSCVLRKDSRLRMSYHVTDDDAGGPAVCYVLVQADEGSRSRLVGSVPCDEWHGSAGGPAANADSRGMAVVLSAAASACGAAFDQESLW